MDSAFFASDDDGVDTKHWDLRNAADVREVVAILDRLYRYTSTTFASRVIQGIGSAKARILQGDFEPWKWDAAGVLDTDEGASSASSEVDSNSVDSLMIVGSEDNEKDPDRSDQVLKTDSFREGEKPNCVEKLEELVKIAVMESRNSERSHVLSSTGGLITPNAD